MAGDIDAGDCVASLQESSTNAVGAVCPLKDSMTPSSSDVADSEHGGRSGTAGIYADRP